MESSAASPMRFQRDFRLRCAGEGMRRSLRERPAFLSTDSGARG
jgi:hypothetical protein